MNVETSRTAAAAAMTTAVSLVALSGGASAGAANPNEFEVSDISIRIPDVENGFVVFVNVTARDWCAWSAAPAGPPPAIEPVTVRGKSTGQGSFVGAYESELPVEIWQFDDAAPQLLDPCDDIADQLADPDTEPFAVGSGLVRTHVADPFMVAPSATVTSTRLDAVLEDQHGRLHDYAWRRSTNDRCGADGLDPCTVETADLTPR
jgi:hypothetical protein